MALCLRSRVRKRGKRGKGETFTLGVLGYFFEGGDERFSTGGGKRKRRVRLGRRATGGKRGRRAIGNGLSDGF